MSSWSASVWAQESAPPASELQELVHRPPPCMDTEGFPLIEARATSSEAARRLAGAVVRFKAEDQTHWYEVAFQPPSGNSFLAVLPKPQPSAVRVLYYFAWGKPELRSPEYLVNVLMGGCPGSRTAPPDLVEEIRIRRTSNEQPEVPARFRPDGIRPGGPSSRTTLGIVAGAAGGAGLAAAVVTGEESAPSDPDPGPPVAVRACFTPDPIPDIDSGDTIRFDASCTTPPTVTSYQWSFGDGTIGQGSSVEHLFRPGGIYTVRLTVSDGERTDGISRLVRVLATPTACFITLPDPPRIRANESISFNAECSMGDRDGGPSPITSYDWDFGDGRPHGEGRFVSRQFTRPDLYGVTLTVTNADGRQDRTTQFVVVERATSVSRPETSFVSELELPPEASAQIAINDSEVHSAAAAPREYRVRLRAGENVIEGRILSDAGGSGRWRFDFRNSRDFVPGSLQVDSGQVLALDGHSLVFEVPGAGGPPIRFRFRATENSP